MDIDLHVAKNNSSNNPVLAMWLVLTTYNTELHDRRSARSGWNWLWFEAFCTELHIDTIFTLVNVTIARAQASPLWSQLSLEPRQFLSDIFGMTPQVLMEETNSIVQDLCQYSSLDFSEKTQRAVVLEIWMQARKAFCVESWCEASLREQLLLKMPEPDIEW